MKDINNPKIIEKMASIGYMPVRDMAGNINDNCFVNQDEEYITIKSKKPSINSTGRPQVPLYFNGTKKSISSSQCVMYAHGELPHEWVKNTWVPDDVPKQDWANTPESVKTAMAHKLGINAIQVDHIVPWSISSDNSFNNLQYLFSSENREKSDSFTPSGGKQLAKRSADGDRFYIETGFSADIILKTEGLSPKSKPSLYRRSVILKLPREAYEKVANAQSN